MKDRGSLNNIFLIIPTDRIILFSPVDSVSSYDFPASLPSGKRVG